MLSMLTTCQYCHTKIKQGFMSAPISLALILVCLFSIYLLCHHMTYACLLSSFSVLNNRYKYLNALFFSKECTFARDMFQSSFKSALKSSSIFTSCKTKLCNIFALALPWITHFTSWHISSTFGHVHQFPLISNTNKRWAAASVVDSFVIVI